MESVYFSEFLTLALIHLLAVASPGPDFAVVLRQSFAQGKATAIYTSVGVGLGVLVHVAYSLLGIGLIVSQSIIGFNIMKIVGALYLMYLGFVAIRSSVKKEGVIEFKPQKHQTALKSLWIGFLTNALNPKATLFFLSLFTVVISPQTPLVVQAGYGLYMCFTTAIWFSLLSLVFSHKAVRNLYYKSSSVLEKMMGAALILLGVKLAFATQD